MQLSKLHAPGNRADEAAAGIGKVLVGETGVGQRLHADQAVFRLEEHLHVARQVTRHHRRQPDAQVHEVAALQVRARCAAR